MQGCEARFAVGIAFLLPLFGEASAPGACRVLDSEVALMQTHDVSTVAKAKADGAWVGARVVEARRLHDKMTLASAALPDGPTKMLLHTFKICAGCQQFARWGEDNDGGYLQCMDDLGAGQVRAAYSLGVENRDKWSDDAHLELGVPVHQYDCTVAGPAQRCPECHFHQVCICEGACQAFPDKTTMGLGEMLEATGQAGAPDRSLLMKMDIEGSEWPLLAAAPVSLLRKFRALTVEFHRLSDETRHKTYLQAMRALLDAGFRVAHVHGNNCCPAYNISGYSLPDFLEATLISHTGGDAECRDPQTLDLDKPNLNYLPDAQHWHLP